MELEVFLGYVSPNHNVDGALIKMVEKDMLVKASNKVGAPIYYLGHFAMEALDCIKLPDKDAFASSTHNIRTSEKEKYFGIIYKSVLKP
jgi:hypothetical protein